MLDWKREPHRRYNPLTREWVLVSPHRTARPWQGQVEEGGAVRQPEYDPECYLCPGNARVGGARNPRYTSTFVFDNDFAALKPDTPLGRFEQDGLLIAEAEPGLCRVVCFSPRHDLTIANMEPADLRRVVDVWAGQFAELGAMPLIGYVQIFENRGAMMGASNPHPHCQIWSNHAIPNEVAKETASQAAWRAGRGGCLLCEYTRLERAAGERVVEENDGFLAVVPFWAVWPFELLLLPRRRVAQLHELTPQESDGLAAILQIVTRGYNQVFETPFPYSMGLHPAPSDGAAHPEWHLHAHFFPPLLRSATVRKFMVGFELLGSPQRDITPESAAETLRHAISLTQEKA
jgi:UDPglucose--hexose-1-phosphate uridylyltransferase